MNRIHLESMIGCICLFTVFAVIWLVTP